MDTETEPYPHMNGSIKRGTVPAILLLVGALVVVVGVLRSPEPAGSAGVTTGTAPSITDPPVPGDALFVATDGSDSAAGGRTNPLRTLTAAVERAGNGATIVLRSGTYRESVGLVRKQLTIRSFPGEQVWLKGSLVIDEWSRTRHGWQHSGWDPDLCHTCFLPEIIDPQHPLAGLPDMVFVDGKPLRQVAERSAVTSGTFFVDPAAKTLLIGSDPGGRTVEAAAFPWLLQFDGPHAAGSTIRGLGITQYAAHQEYGQRGAMVVVNAPSVTLVDNTFTFSAAAGAAVFRPKGVLVGNSFTDNGLVGMMANRADDLRLSGNVFSRNNREHFALSGEAIGAAGAKITRTRRPLVAHNSFVDNIGTGWWCDLGCTDATVVGNVARGNAVHGLYYEVSSTALIASNLIVDNGGRGLKISSSDRVSVHHNTFTGNDTAIGLYNDKRSPAFDPYSERLGLSWITERTRLVNNYFAGTRSAAPFVVSADYKPAGVPTPAFFSRSDGNVYLRTDESPLATWFLGSGATTRFASLEQLRARTGQGQHSIEHEFTTTPFRDPAAGDYTLRPEAPGVRAGRPLTAELAEVVGVEPDAHPDVGLLVRPGPR